MTLYTYAISKRDLTNQYISTSYQDVVQRYLTGSVDYFLDGLGYTIVGVPTSSIGGIVLTQDQTASWAVSASYAVTSSVQYQVSSSWASQSYHSNISDVSITSSYSLYSELSNTASTSILSEFSDTASLTLYSNFSGTSSYAIPSSWAPPIASNFSISSSWSSQSLSASWAPSSVHIEKGIVSGSLFSGMPLNVNINYVQPFLNNIYTISIIGEDARIWTVNNRTTSSFIINSNSNQTILGMVMWRVEQI